ncbi:MAG: hypothetical protein JSR17_08860 [Proteobacteria bacterium]|nr:hypothetical protein [Pseudomonadota bacterium]
MSLQNGPQKNHSLHRKADTSADDAPVAPPPPAITYRYDRQTLIEIGQRCANLEPPKPVVDFLIKNNIHRSSK